MLDILDIALAIFLGNMMTIMLLVLLAHIYSDRIDEGREYKHGKNGGKLL